VAHDAFDQHPVTDEVAADEARANSQLTTGPSI
jgi:hypothetical protein